MVWNTWWWNARSKYGKYTCLKSWGTKYKSILDNTTNGIIFTTTCSIEILVIQQINLPKVELTMAKITPIMSKPIHLHTYQPITFNKKLTSEIYTQFTPGHLWMIV
jgi:hypothetical protein